jgi:DNA-binding transcriptional MocR family regulator
VEHDTVVGTAERPALAYDAVLRPVRQGNAFEETVERLLQVIKLGMAPVGGRLPAERDLSLRLGVSRATLRDAIAALQRAGYVESRRGRYGGTFVRAIPLTRPAPMRTAAERIAELDDASPCAGSWRSVRPSWRPGGGSSRPRWFTWRRRWSPAAAPSPRSTET